MQLEVTQFCGIPRRCWLLRILFLVLEHFLKFLNLRSDNSSAVAVTFVGIEVVLMVVFCWIELA